jgi:hypothetical protein
MSVLLQGRSAGESLRFWYNFPGDNQAHCRRRELVAQRGECTPAHDQGPQAGRLKPCKGFPHGMPTTHADTITADLLACIKG